MESDDDYLSFSPAQEEPSPPLHHRKLKRLKKSINVANEVVALQLPVEKPLESRDLETKWVHQAFGGESELGSIFEGKRSSGFGDLGVRERSGRGGGEGENAVDLEIEEKRMNEEGLNESKGCDDDEEELDRGFDGVKFGEERKETKTVLDFDDIGERVEKKRVNEEDLNESEGCDGDDDDDELNCGFDGMGFGDGRMETKRVLDFGDIGEGFDGERLDRSGGVEDSIAAMKKVRREKKRAIEEDSTEIKGKKKKKKKEQKSAESNCADVKPKDRRREEKVV